MGASEFSVPDDLSELLGPDITAPPTPPTLASPAVTGAVLAGDAGGSTRAKLERGRMLFGRRLSVEQREVQAQLEAEVRVGGILDRLARVGARVLHDRRGPDGSHLDHVVISESGVHLVETVASSKRLPLNLADPSCPRVGGLPLRQRLVHLRELNRLVAGQVETMLTTVFPFTVYPLAAVTGANADLAVLCFDVDLVAAPLVPRWITRLPAVQSPLAVAALTEAVATVCPPAL